jgi:hypothetical protein
METIISELVGRGVSALGNYFGRTISRSRRTGRKRAGPTDQASGSLKFFFQFALVAGGKQITISDTVSNSEFLVEMGRIYRQYRFTRVKVTLIPSDISTGVNLACIYTAGPYATSPVLITDVEGEYICLTSDCTTVPISMVIPHAALNPTHSWFSTTGDASEPSADIIGMLDFRTANSSTEVIPIILEIDYEFCNPLDPDIITPNIIRLDKVILKRDLKRLDTQELQMNKKKDGRKEGKIDRFLHSNN